LPRSLAAGASLIAALSDSGALREIGDEFRVTRRAGGFAGVDAVIFLLAFFGSGWSIGGLRGFAEAHATFAQVIGVLAGRVRLMGQASLSRLLDSVDVAGARKLGRRLLRDHVGSLEVLRSAAVQSTDARGEAWHVFDFDPNREVYRRRELARAEERPRGARRTEGLARAGHRGRKRGEVVLTQGMLSHHGSGLWLDASVTAGNGDPREMLGGALLAVVECCEALGHACQRALVRTDGEFRGVPSFAAAQAAGVAFLTRLSRYEMLDDPEVRKRLSEARWERVDDAGGGPIRIAADLGMVQLEAGETTVDDAGERFAPVDVRVVVSAYPCGDDGHDSSRRGHRIGGTMFEMFGAVGLPAEAWSAADAVCAYYGRCAQENRFAQADRELGIDRSFSFAAGGHLLALVCALATWNWRIVQAIRDLPLPAPRHPSARIVVSASAPEVLAPPLPVDLVEPTTEQTSPDALTEFDAAMGDVAIQNALVARALPWNAVERIVIDHAGEAWELGSAVVNKGVPNLSFTRRESDGRRRHRSVTVPIDALLRVQAAMKAMRGQSTRSTIRALATRPPQRSPQRSFHIRPEQSFQTEAQSGYVVGWPLFLPARARKRTVHDLAYAVMRLDANLRGPPADPGHPLMAASIEAVRRRRWSWSARLARMAAPPGASAAITVVARASQQPTFEGK
jgi:hypothetical protein